MEVLRRPVRTLEVDFGLSGPDREWTNDIQCDCVLTAEADRAPQRTSCSTLTFGTEAGLILLDESSDDTPTVSPRDTCLLIFR